MSFWSDEFWGASFWAAEFWQEDALPPVVTGEVDSRRFMSNIGSMMSR